MAPCIINIKEVCILYIRKDTLNKRAHVFLCSDDDQFNERSVKEQEHGKCICKRQLNACLLIYSRD